MRLSGKNDEPRTGICPAERPIGARALAIFLSAPIQAGSLGLKLVSVAKQPGGIIGCGERPSG